MIGGRSLIAAAALAFTVIVAVACMISFAGAALTGDASGFADITAGIIKLGAILFVIATFAILYVKARGDGD